MSCCSAKQVIPYIQPSQTCHKGTYPTHLQHQSQKKLPLYFFCASLTFLSLSLAFNAMDSHTLDKTETVFQCGNCQLPVSCEHQRLQCDTCNHWFHAPCQRVGDCLYDYLSNSNCSWHCTKCNSLNYSQASSQNMSSLSINNRFNILNTTEQGFAPTSSSTPVKKTRQKLKNLKPLLKLPSSTSSQSGKRNPSFTHLLKDTNPTSLSGRRHGYPQIFMTQNISHQSWVILSIGVTEQDRKGAGLSSSSNLLICLKKSLSTKLTVKVFGYRSTSMALGQFSLELIINHRNTTSSALRNSTNP